RLRHALPRAHPAAVLRHHRGPRKAHHGTDDRRRHPDLRRPEHDRRRVRSLMATFKLDGKDIPFEPGDTIIKAAWRQGIEIPHYCWHPGLSAPANCRMCLVEILPKPGMRPMSLDIVQWDAAAGDYKVSQKPKLQPACYIQAGEGMEILSDSSQNVSEA